MSFPTKNDHFGVFWGYPYFRKRPYSSKYPYPGDPGSAYENGFMEPKYLTEEGIGVTPIILENKVSQDP